MTIFVLRYFILYRPIVVTVYSFIADRLCRLFTESSGTSLNSDFGSFKLLQTAAGYDGHVVCQNGSGVCLVQC